MNSIYDFAFSAQGYNHIKANKVCQDSSGHYTDDCMSIVVVADGHGSDDYPRTDKGSRYAVEAAIGSIKEFVETVVDCNVGIAESPEAYLEQLAKSILSKWYAAVYADVAEHPFTQAEMDNASDRYQKRYLSGRKSEKAYGTTLIAACQTESFWFGIQIGDGKCVTISTDGTIEEPIPWDENCQSNITTSICDSDAINEFRYAFKTKCPAATLMGTDGIDDSYADEEELYVLYRSILSIFAEHGRQVGENEVSGFLPGLSRRGSGDDVSIAGIVSAKLSIGFVALLKAQCEYKNALAQKEKAEHEVTLAAERYVYVCDALQKAKKTFENCNQKEAEARNAVEQAKETQISAGERYIAAQETLKQAVQLYSHEHDSAEDGSQQPYAISISIEGKDG